MKLRFLPLLLDPTADSGGGATTTTEADPGQTTDRVAEALQSLLKKHGDANAVALLLLQENHGYREKLREARAKLPPEGALVLAGDDATRWAAYRQLGEPTALATLRDEHATLSGEVATHRREKLVGEAATLSGYKPAVLSRLAGDLALEIRDVTENGKTTRRAVVVEADDRATPLSDYAEREWKDFLPALKAPAATTPDRPLGTPARRATQGAGAASGTTTPVVEPPPPEPPIRFGRI